MNKKVVIIGAGIGGLGAAGLFAKKGYDVTVLEKNANLGGRANIFEAHGFRLDMRPSWYLAPDIFEHFFDLMGERVENHLDLVRLDPSCRIFFRKDRGRCLRSIGVGFSKSDGADYLHGIDSYSVRSGA